MSYRRRLFVYISLLLFVTLGIAFSAVFFIVQRTDVRDLDETLYEAMEAEAREVVVRGQGADIEDDPVIAPDNITRLTKYGAVYGVSGNVLAKTPSFQCQVPPLSEVQSHGRTPFNLRCGRLELRALVSPLPAHKELTLLLAVPRSQIDEDARSLVQTLGLCLLLALGFAALTTRFLARELARDHEAIARALRQVAKGNLKTRVEAKSRTLDTQQLARDVDNMVERLEQLVISQRRFIAHAAHELRSPVTALYGELDLALRKERDAAEYREAIEHAHDSAKQLKALAEDLLALARTGSGEGAQMPTELRDILSGAVDTVQRARKSEVTIEVESDDGMITGRARDLERLVRNLVENAVRHSPTGGVVRVVGHVRDGLCTVTVEDQGKGVAEKDRARLFEPFYRGADVRASDEGTGLGLAIAREIARAHGGDLMLDDTKDGARFRVTLRTAPHGDDAEAEPAS
jgi:two-component system heavy metal sensor histidine kinase CusS